MISQETFFHFNHIISVHTIFFPYYSLKWRKIDWSDLLALAFSLWIEVNHIFYIWVYKNILWVLQMKSVKEKLALWSIKHYLSGYNGANCHRQKREDQWESTRLTGSQMTAPRHWAHPREQSDLPSQSFLCHDSKHKTSQLQILEMAHFKCHSLSTSVSYQHHRQALKLFNCMIYCAENAQTQKLTQR